MTETAPAAEPDPRGATDSRSPNAEISREIVKAHAHYYGRGPTKARTVWKDDIVVVLLEEIFTRAEQTLVTSGHFEKVRATRQAFQDEVESLFRQIVEQATGREVRGFLSQISPEGIAAEVFILVRSSDGTAPARVI